MAKLVGVLASVAMLGAWLLPASLEADETCLSPYMAKIVGQEDFVYVWRPQRGAPLGPYRRPPLPVGGGPRHQQDLHLRHRQRPSEAAAR